jgi:hypothetical protein
MENPCEGDCLVKGICSEICEKSIEYHKYLQSELIKDIVKDDPHIIVMEGSTDPYSNNSFYYSLINIKDELIQYGLDLELAIVTITKEEWIKETMKLITHDCRIRLIGDVNYLGNFNNCENYEKNYIEHGTFTLEYGGVLWSNRIEDIKK